MIPLILLVFAFVLLVIAAYSTPGPPEGIWRNRLALLGLACWVLAEIVVRAPGALHG